MIINNEQERLRIGKRIANLRKLHGMTQQQLAEKSGISREHITRIEAGKYSVGLDILTSIAVALDTQFDFI